MACQRAPSGRFEQAAAPDDPLHAEAWADLETRHTDIRRNIERATIEPYRQRLGLPAAMPLSDIEAAIEHTDNDLWMPSLEPGYGWDVYVFDDDPMLL